MRKAIDVFYSAEGESPEISDAKDEMLWFLEGLAAASKITVDVVDVDIKPDEMDADPYGIVLRSDEFIEIADLIVTELLNFGWRPTEVVDG